MYDRLEWTEEENILIKKNKQKHITMCAALRMPSNLSQLTHILFSSCLCEYDILNACAIFN